MAKEKVYYEKEAQKEKEKCEKMKAEGEDEHSVKKQVSHSVMTLVYDNTKSR